MAKSLNMCIFIGNLGADPEVRSLPNGSQVANFSIACTENWKDASGQKQERTEWIRCNAWRGLAEIAQKYLNKGSRVHIIGKFRTRQWEKDGQKQYSTEIEVAELIMLGDGNGGGGQGGQGGGARPAAARAGGGSGFEDFEPGNVGIAPAGPAADDDLPF